MANAVLMPKLGLTMTEGTIEKWYKNVGDTVKKGENLFAVATDKLTNDVEADCDGVLLKIITGEGDTADCKATIAYIGEAGEQVEDTAAPAAAAPAAETAAAAPAPVAAAAAPVARAAGEYVLATPYAKKLAKEKGYNIADIAGTGPKGTVVAKDVEAFVAGPRVKVSPVAAKMAAEMGVDVNGLYHGERVMKADVLAAAGAGVEAVAPAAVEADADKVIKVSPLRRSIAANMSKSWTTSPRVTFTRPVDVTEMKALRAKLKEPLAKKGIKLTFNHIIMKVVAKALTEFPEINSSFADNMLSMHPHVNMGLAVAKDGGLIVPNLKNCEEKSLAEIAAETEVLIEKARSGKLALDEMTGGTFTISNLGSYGITSFSPIINQPELAILGVCAMVDTPVVKDGQIVVRTMMNLSLTADHRVVDGVQASEFLQRIAELLENPLLLLA